MKVAALRRVFAVSLFLILALGFGLLPTQAQEAAPAKKTVKILENRGVDFLKAIRIVRGLNQIGRVDVSVSNRGRRLKINITDK